MGVRVAGLYEIIPIEWSGHEQDYINLRKAIAFFLHYPAPAWGARREWDAKSVGR
jgi:hypothetical protein